MPSPKIVLLFALFISVALSAFCKTSGKKILDSNGQEIFLKGISLGNWLNPQGYMFNFDKISYYRVINTAFAELMNQNGARGFWQGFRNTYITADDFKYIKKVGFNTVRLPFSYKLFIDDDHADVIKEEGFTRLSFAIQQCKLNNLYIVLDMHSAPGGQTGANIDDSYGFPFIYDSEYYTNLTLTLWKLIANRYRDETTVLGYELLNEPISTDFNTTYFSAKLEPLYKRITSAIRQVDKNHIIILDGAVWASQFGCFGSPFDSNLVYTFHKYWVDPVQGNIQEYIDFSNRYNVPIWMGESGQNSDSWIQTFRILLEKNGVHWSFWPYKKMSASSCIRTITQPNGWDQIISYVEGDRSTLTAVAARRPGWVFLDQTFKGLMSAMEFNNTHSNSGYIKALGLNP